MTLINKLFKMFSTPETEAELTDFGGRGLDLRPSGSGMETCSQSLKTGFFFVADIEALIR